MRHGTLWAMGVAVLASAWVARGGESWTYVELVERLTDLEALAVLPPRGEKCQQWSSYDRRSRYDAEKGAYVGWSANGDGNGVIRREGDRQVLAQMEGPGVIWRIWSAKPEKGPVRMYLDGAKEPAVDLPFRGYFDGEHPPFQGEALCHVVARGWNCYVPIPFQESCKVVAEDGWGRYYHFTYTTYPQGTVVPTFRLPLSEAQRAALARANDFLTEKLGTDPAGQRPGQETVSRTVAVPGGEAALVARLDGPKAITALRAKLELPESPEDIKVLRELCLRITWDGEAKPAVWSPLGDFFGAAPGTKEYRSLPLGMADGAMYCLWYMPFAQSAKVELVNDGEERRTADFELTVAPLSRPIESLGRFHAKWHRDAFLPEEPARRAIDWTMLKTPGRGRYTGVMLHVWNPRGGWWGEGDEKFFVDGEKFPSTFGTGSEDYFGYAWCCPQRFTNAFHNQPHNDGGNRGHVCVNRWHVTDNCPFHTGFEAAIEKYYPNSRPTLYAALATWYLAPGQADPYDEVPVAERTGYYKPPENLRVEGAIEGEKLEIAQKTRGNARRQDLFHYDGKWSDMAHLWWTGAKPEDKLTLAFPVEEAGRYQLLLQLTKARDYGIVQLHLDGEKLGEPLDLYNPQVVPTGQLHMGTHELAEGQHRLTLEIVGANEKAVKAYMAGLDYIKLEPAD
ncbi:MAG: glycoside hydrolase family 172 protein [Candidatus Brocadiia bacterium]